MAPGLEAVERVHSTVWIRRGGEESVGAVGEFAGHTHTVAVTVRVWGSGPRIL